MCSSFWKGLLVATAMTSSVFALEELPAKKVVLGDRTLRVGQMYKAHDKYWQEGQCLEGSIYTTTLEECKTDCTNDYRCNAFNHQASESTCQLMGCPLPYPEPSGSYTGWKGYSIDAGISCPPYFIPVGYQCLYFSTGNLLVWAEAAEVCKVLNASLFVLDDNKEIMNHVGAVNGKSNFWIGAHYKMPEVYKAHNKHWTRQQCPWNDITFTATLDECKTACSNDYVCTAFMHHASESKCQLVSCPVPAPEPTDTHPGWMGYSVEPVYKAHNKHWTPMQCSYGSRFPATLEECQTACTRDTPCTALHHHASRSDCQLLSCPLPVPEPIGSASDTKSMGYSIVSGTWLWLNGEPVQSGLLTALRHPHNKYQDGCLISSGGVVTDTWCLDVSNYICMTAPLDQVNPETSSLPLQTASTASTPSDDV